LPEQIPNQRQCGSFVVSSDHRIHEGDALWVVFLEPTFGRFFVGENFEMLGVADFLACIDIDPISETGPYFWPEIPKIS
jgi:hypothetical protein